MKKIGRTIKRRRREGRTDYKARLGLLKSKNQRLVLRKTGRYVIAQIVETNIAQDKVVMGVSSKDLLKNGWPSQNAGSLKNRMACYLTGLLLAKKAGDMELNLDLGLERNIHKGRLYAVVKGAIDGGLRINSDEKALPSDEMIESNEKLKSIFHKVKGEIIKNG